MKKLLIVAPLMVILFVACKKVNDTNLLKHSGSDTAKTTPATITSSGKNGAIYQSPKDSVKTTTVTTTVIKPTPPPPPPNPTTPPSKDSVAVNAGAKNGGGFNTPPPPLPHVKDSVLLHN